MNFLEHENNHLLKLKDKEEKKKEEKKKEEKGKVKKKHASRSDKVPIGSSSEFKIYISSRNKLNSFFSR